MTAPEQDAYVSSPRSHPPTQRLDARVNYLPTLGFVLDSYLDAWGWTTGNIALFVDIAFEYGSDMYAFIAELRRTFPSISSEQAIWFWNMLPKVEE